MKVLDIGCGWGGMGLTLARDYGAEVLGVTLSEEQLKVARARAEAAGLSDRVRFELMDYRAVAGQFDRIVSVGMFEHVGAPNFGTYFTKVEELLKPEGVALIHTIGRFTPPGSTNPWITRYIFPGGYIPALSETMAAVEKTGLVSTDVEVWRLHYAYTLRHWYDRFMARQDEAAALYDERFVRMWKFYLVASEQTFRFAGQCVFQLQLARDQQAVPLTRDYLYEPGGRGPERASRPLGLGSVALRGGLGLGGGGFLGLFGLGALRRPEVERLAGVLLPRMAEEFFQVELLLRRRISHAGAPNGGDGWSAADQLSAGSGAATPRVAEALAALGRLPSPRRTKKSRQDSPVAGIAGAVIAGAEVVRRCLSVMGTPCLRSLLGSARQGGTTSGRNHIGPKPGPARRRG